MQITNSEERFINMSADASKFSLVELTETLKPYIDELQFRPFWSPHVLEFKIPKGQDPNWEVHVYKGHARTDMSFISEDMMTHMFTFDTVNNHDAEMSAPFVVRNLIAKRIRGGGDSIDWYVMTVPICFSRSSAKQRPFLFESVPGVEIKVADRDFEGEVRGYSLLAERIWYGAMSWVRSSNLSRQGVIARLDKLQKKVDERWARYSTIRIKGDSADEVNA